MHGGFINPEKVLGQLGIKPGITIADFGCGHGYFSVPAGKLTGPDGKVLAIDVLGEALEMVRSRAQTEGVLNIETLRGNLEISGGAKISAGSVDMVLLHNILFQSQKKAEIIREAWRILKPSGELVLTEWKPGNGATAANLGPQDGWKISEEDAKKMAQDAGLRYQKNFDAGEFHYGLVFSKP